MKNNTTIKKKQHKKSTPTAVSKLWQRRQVVIPKDICESLGIDVGDFIEVGEKHGAIILQPKKLVDPYDEVTPEDAKAIRQGMAEIKRGDCVAWKQVKHNLDL